MGFEYPCVMIDMKIKQGTRSIDEHKGRLPVAMMADEIVESDSA